jgi:hypothetical protein
MRTAILIMLLLASPAMAQDAAIEAEAFDVAIDVQEYAGKRVKIRNCYLYNAKITTVNCGVLAPNGNQIGSILLDVKTMAPMSKRRALSECAGDEAVDACKKLTVTGRVKAVLGGKYAEVTNATIGW